jgi:hypothetical protein
MREFAESTSAKCHGTSMDLLYLFALAKGKFKAFSKRHVPSFYWTYFCLGQFLLHSCKHLSIP